MSMTSTMTAEATSPLTALDRCDADCTAQAYVRVTMPTGAPLLFCGHHYRKNADALATRDAVRIEDFTADIHDGKPGASA